MPTIIVHTPDALAYASGTNSLRLKPGYDFTQDQVPLAEFGEELQMGTKEAMAEAYVCLLRLEIIALLCQTAHAPLPKLLPAASGSKGAGNGSQSLPAWSSLQGQGGSWHGRARSKLSLSGDPPGYRGD
ncbi:hypothetical protein [Aliiroseovarius subalbicans]|uniref:hypothetical protein n=1 Tax=Aliiroseovarius subalbicans TaxID=2925840 RepID=UPI001F5A9109|nr:hypothetical protein [Aliiroseovarius subalbicans]MCI2400708.1 hypothetical protein [Aliiroseovarius subalbicans]